MSTREENSLLTGEDTGKTEDLTSARTIEVCAARVSQQGPVLAAVGNALRNRRTSIALALLAVGGCTALLLRNACATKAFSAGPASVISLVESAKEDLIHLPHADGDAVGKFLADDEHKDTQPSPMTDKAADKLAVEAVRRALTVDENTASTAVKIAMSNGAKKWEKKRRALKVHLAKNQTRALRLPFPQIPAKIASVIPQQRTADEKANVASCVFDVTQSVSQIAALAANIRDAAETCKNVGPGSLDEFAQKTCAVNVESIFYSAASIAATLSMAANNCAATFEPNLDALCAGSIATMVQSVAQLGIASQLIAASCAPHEQDRLIPGITPSNVGSFGRRLSPQNASEHAEARRLLFGGGKGSTGTQCAVDITSALWYLAEAGLAINAAANKNAGQACPPKTFFQGKPTSGMDYRRSKAFCAADVAGAIYGFLQATYFLYFSASHCLDMLNTEALCGAGITGLMASLDGVAYSGTTMWLTCEDLRRQWPMPGAGSPLSKQMLQKNVLGQSGQGGRRLEGEEGLESAVPQFKEKFSSPEEAFQSLGFDLGDKNAAFRQARAEMPKPQDVVELLDEMPAQEQAGLLGLQQVCA